MKKDQFIEAVFEIAFGDDMEGYSYDDVLDQLREFSDHALKYEEEEGLV